MKFTDTPLLANRIRLAWVLFLGLCLGLQNLSAQSTQTLHIHFGGSDRLVYLRIPPTADTLHPVPLVIDLHGYSNTALGQAQLSGFRTRALLDTFAVAWPQGLENSWNIGTGCCGTAAKENRDDVGFIKTAVNQIRFLYPIDGHRIYITGHSNGGAMTERMAAEASDIFAAAVDYSGWIEFMPEPKRAIPILHFHAIQDVEIPIEGDSQIPSAETTLVRWKEAEGCQGDPDTVVLDSTTQSFCETFTQCRDSSHISLCKIAGDHMIYNNTPRIDITLKGWEFMRNFRLENPLEVVPVKQLGPFRSRTASKRSRLKTSLKLAPHRYLGRGWEGREN